MTHCLIPKSGRKYSQTNSYNSAMTVIVQDDHLTAGAWVACGRAIANTYNTCRTIGRIKQNPAGFRLI